MYYKNVTRWAFWYHLYNLKNMKNTHGGVLLLAKLQVKNNFIKSNTAPQVFSRFLHCTIGTKSLNVSQIDVFAL